MSSFFNNPFNLMKLQAANLNIPNSKTPLYHNILTKPSIEPLQNLSLNQLVMLQDPQLLNLHYMSLQLQMENIRRQAISTLRLPQVLPVIQRSLLDQKLSPSIQLEISKHITE